MEGKKTIITTFKHVVKVEAKRIEVKREQLQTVKSSRA